MTRDTHRQSVPDRARRRAIRAYAARHGIPYSVAARLLSAHNSRSSMPRVDGSPGPGGGHHARAFALRETDRWDLRVRATRLAADLPLGRATHLVGRFPHHPGTDRETVLGLLYTVVAVESPALLPSPAEGAWVAELGEESAVDTACAAADRAARLLLDLDRWALWTRVEAALATRLTDADRRIRDTATVLDRQFRTVVLRGSLDGARQTLDAVSAAGSS